MNVQLLATFLLISSCAYFVASDITYVQLSTSPQGSCVTWNCMDMPNNEDRYCKRRWIKDGQSNSDAFFMKKTEAKNTFDVYSYGRKDGITIVKETDHDVIKYTAKNSTGIVKVACVTKAREQTNKDKEILPKLCNGTDMIEVDNNDCT